MAKRVLVTSELPVSAGRGGPRSEPTRRAILAAARARFAADGYERATIRAIAADAGVDPSMVMRYYGSKEQLFAAAAELDLRLPDLSSVPRDQLGLALARHFMSLWESAAGNEDALMFLFRSALTNEAAADRLRRQVFRDQVTRHITGVAPDHAERRAGLIATQLLGVALCRYILRLRPVVEASPDTLIADLAPTLQRYLTGPLSPPR
jgi:AcrR family transcriptional regulator